MDDFLLKFCVYDFHEIQSLRAQYYFQALRFRKKKMVFSLLMGFLFSFPLSIKIFAIYFAG